MSTTSIGWQGVAASLVLVAVTLVLSWRLQLGLGRTTVWAVGRAAVQLVLVGVALGLVLAPDAWLGWSWLWVVAMVVFASITVGRRAPEVPDGTRIALAAITTVAVVSLGVVFGLGIFPLEARALVPVAGMVIGNALGATVVAGRRIVDEVADHREVVEVRLALGQPWPRVVRPHVTSALRTAITPQIESVKVLGLIFLPGSMTGLILAGVDPRDAVLVQLALMYLILGSVTVSVTVVALGLGRRLFTPDHRLVRAGRASVGGG